MPRAMVADRLNRAAAAYTSTTCCTIRSSYCTLRAEVSLIASKTMIGATRRSHYSYTTRQRSLASYLAPTCQDSQGCLGGYKQPVCPVRSVDSLRYARGKRAHDNNFLGSSGVHASTQRERVSTTSQTIYCCTYHTYLQPP